MQDGDSVYSHRKKRNNIIPTGAAFCGRDASTFFNFLRSSKVNFVYTNSSIRNRHQSEHNYIEFIFTANWLCNFVCTQVPRAFPRSTLRCVDCCSIHNDAPNHSPGFDWPKKYLRENFSPHNVSIPPDE